VQYCLSLMQAHAPLAQFCDQQACMDWPRCETQPALWVRLQYTTWLLLAQQLVELQQGKQKHRGCHSACCIWMYMGWPS
jgi:hypothetical protein